MREGLPEGAIELGSDHWFTFFVGKPEHYPNAPEEFKNFHGHVETLIGIIEWHLTPEGVMAPPASPGGAATFERELCGGAVYFLPQPAKPDAPVWQVHSIEPLHIEPSVWCKPEKGGCGSHGWIRGGKWVEAA